MTAQQGHYGRVTAFEAAEGGHCKECHPELHRAQCSRGGCVVELQAELDELERTDPDVAAAAACYDRMVERITGRILPPRETPPITDHAYRPNQQGQCVTGRCDLCGEPKSAHLACTCHVRSDAIGPHTRGCPNHPEVSA